MWIELSELNFKLFIPLIFPIFKRIQDAEKKLYIIKDNQIFKSFRYFTSYILSFIFLIIIYFRTRQKQNRTKKDEEINELLKRQTLVISETASISLTQTNTINELKIKNTKKRSLQSIAFLAVLCAMGLFCYFFRHFSKKIIIEMLNKA